MTPTYSDYLRLPELLGQCHPRSTEHDELLFITVHQACELWFRQILAELTAARDGLLAGDSYAPRSHLRRCCRIERVLASHFDVLDTMAPTDFLRFRDALGRASGQQSAQYHQIERLSARSTTEPTVWDGFLAVLDKSGFLVETRDDRFTAYREIATNRPDHEALWELAEALVDHDQAWSLFRHRHAHTVERQIGHKPGTAGTRGAQDLTDRAHLYPELWELRTTL